MKISTLRSFALAGMFAIMPAFVFANDKTATPNTAPQQGTIQELRAALAYPKYAVQKNIQGKFTMLVNVDEAGNVSAVNFEVPNSASTEELTPLLRDVSTKIYQFKFNAEYAGQTLRMPFSFQLY